MGDEYEDFDSAIHPLFSRSCRYSFASWCSGFGTDMWVLLTGVLSMRWSCNCSEGIHPTSESSLAKALQSSLNLVLTTCWSSSGRCSIGTGGSQCSRFALLTGDWLVFRLSTRPSGPGLDVCGRWVTEWVATLTDCFSFTWAGYVAFYGLKAPHPSLTWWNNVPLSCVPNRDG